MRSGLRSLIPVIVVLASSFSWAQQVQLPEEFPLLVRLSYSSTWYLQSQNDPRRVCLAVSQDGRYRMLRSTAEGTFRVQGTLSSSSLLVLRKLLEDPGFQGLESDDASLVRGGAESLMAEVPGKNSTQRLRWTNPDKERPFPPAVRNLANWLYRFKAENPEPLDADDSDICPSGQLRPLHPGLAKN